MRSTAKPVINLQLLSKLTPRLLIFISNDLSYYTPLLKVNPSALFFDLLHSSKVSHPPQVCVQKWENCNINYFSSP